MYQTRSLAEELGGLAIVVALHVLGIAALLQMGSVRSSITSAAPIIARLITTPTLEKPDATPTPLTIEPSVERAKPKPKPRVKAPEPEPKPPVMTALTEAPSSAAPQPAQAPPDPPATAVSPPALPAEPATAPEPLPITPPTFSAGYLNNPAPSYPLLSRRLKEEGRVVLRVFVNDRGLPEEIELKSSSGFSRLDGVALETVKRWKFVPARRGDQPVSAWVLVPISFSLRS